MRDAPKSPKNGVYFLWKTHGFFGAGRDIDDIDIPLWLGMVGDHPTCSYPHITSSEIQRHGDCRHVLLGSQNGDLMLRRNKRTSPVVAVIWSYVFGWQ